MNRNSDTSIAEDEIARFSSQAESWWELDGAFRALHKMNPLRVEYVRDQVCTHFNRKWTATNVLQGLRILDIGCGGGLMSEALAKMGADVTGMDASPEVLAEAKRHAKQEGIRIHYVEGGVEALAKKRQYYDAVIAMEVIEHVASRELFLKSLAALVKPKGLLIMATLNRTMRSFLMGVIMAEFILRWVPVGTHDWEKFIRPSKLVRMLAVLGITATDLTGILYSPLTGKFEKSKENLSVNYLLTAVKTEG